MKKFILIALLIFSTISAAKNTPISDSLYINIKKYRSYGSLVFERNGELIYSKNKLKNILATQPLTKDYLIKSHRDIKWCVRLFFAGIFAQGYAEISGYSNYSPLIILWIPASILNKTSEKHLKRAIESYNEEVLKRSSQNP